MMRVSRAQAEESRERILREAGRLFRERGFDGVGVAELMKAAGLTNGAFYSHFDSKDHLIAEICERVLAGSRDPWAALEREELSLPAFMADYLSLGHAQARGEGCTFAALGGDVARQRLAARAAFTDTLRASLAALEPRLQDETGSDARGMAIFTLAAMAGALMLARAVDDLALSREFLDAVRGRLLNIAGAGEAGV